MSDRQPIGDLLDGLGVTSDLDGLLVSGAMVLMKTVDEHGAVGVKVAWSDGLSWFDRRALVEIARGAEIEDTEVEES